MARNRRSAAGEPFRCCGHGGPIVLGQPAPHFVGDRVRASDPHDVVAGDAARPSSASACTAVPHMPWRMTEASGKSFVPTSSTSAARHLAGARGRMHLKGEASCTLARSLTLHDSIVERLRVRAPAQRRVDVCQLVDARDELSESLLLARRRMEPTELPTLASQGARRGRQILRPRPRPPDESRCRLRADGVHFVRECRRRTRNHRERSRLRTAATRHHNQAQTGRRASAAAGPDRPLPCTTTLDGEGYRSAPPFGR